MATDLAASLHHLRATKKIASRPAGPSCAFKIHPSSELSGIGKLSEYYHMVVDLLPFLLPLLEHCTDSVHLLTPDWDDAASRCTAGETGEQLPASWCSGRWLLSYRGRSMHGVLTAFTDAMGLRLNVSQGIDRATLQHSDAVSLLLRGNDDSRRWSAAPPKTYDWLRRTAWRLFGVASTNASAAAGRSVVVIRRSAPSGALEGEMTGAARRHLPPSYFANASALSASLGAELVAASLPLEAINPGLLPAPRFPPLSYCPPSLVSRLACSHAPRTS